MTRAGWPLALGCSGGGISIALTHNGASQGFQALEGLAEEFGLLCLEAEN